ncbi:hypothetical protein NMG60_11003644 [Bertholletia excelsa]
MASSSSEPAMKAEIGAGEIPEGAAEANDQLLLYRGPKKAKKDRGSTAKERISKMPPCVAGKRSSIYRGVTRHRWTGRYEAHLWDKSTWNQNQNKKGKQVYLGAYDDEEAAARAYDLAALKYWGPGTLINFPVTDYSRDLEEMQNVSREEYLASLRRKSSSFSSRITKYRGLSSRWDPSLGRMAGPDYFNSINYGTGEDTGAESEYAGGFCIDRKIDLTPYIKWWGPNKSHHSDSITKSSEETNPDQSDDIGNELKTLERVTQSTEPYQMPRLGLFHERKKDKTSRLSAMSVLSRSAAYKSLQEKVSKKQEKHVDDDEKENKSTIRKMDYGKAVEKSSVEGRSEGLGVDGGLPLQRNMYPLAPFLTAPLLTNYNSIDPLSDPMLWATLVPGLPSGLSRTTEAAKTESSSKYTFFQQDE